VKSHGCERVLGKKLGRLRGRPALNFQRERERTENVRTARCGKSGTIGQAFEVYIVQVGETDALQVLLEAGGKGNGRGRKRSGRVCITKNRVEGTSNRGTGVKKESLMAQSFGFLSRFHGPDREEKK